ncbi:MAG: site-specific integrase [Alistipes sp.]|nr:site-specific integrase [Alistipes sp.]
MTSYRFHYHPPVSGTAATGGLFIRIIHARKYRDIKRNYPVRPGDWDNSARRLLLPDTASGGRGEQLRQIDASMRADLSRLESIVKTLSEAGPYTVGDITRAFHETGNGDTVLSFAREVANQLEQEGRERTARAYRSAARSLIRFNGGRDLPLGDICELKLRSYERWLLDKGLQMNTVSFYMRNLRALYYRAAAAKLITPAENKPFKSVYTGVYETRRRSLNRQDINALAELERKLPAGSKSLRNALFYFMFAYHARGMSFIDLAYLKKSDIRDGTIIYKRKKTGSYLEVKITRPMKKIIGRFRAVTKVSPLCFPYNLPVRRRPPPALRIGTEPPEQAPEGTGRTGGHRQEYLHTRCPSHMGHTG